MPSRWIALTVALSMSMALTAAHAGEPTEAERLKTSLAKWKQAREEGGGDYSYQVRWSSAFGFGHATTITVQANKVVERKYEVFGRPMPGEKPAEQKPKWVETDKDLGSHKGEGAAPRTLDEIYAEAAKLLETPLPAGHRRFLGFDKHGILSHCLTVDTRIADDAPRTGVSLSQLQLKAKKQGS
jgi:hypothetical protein